MTTLININHYAHQGCELPTVSYHKTAVKCQLTQFRYQLPPHRKSTPYKPQSYTSDPPARPACGERFVLQAEHVRQVRRRQARQLRRTHGAVHGHLGLRRAQVECVAGVRVIVLVEDHQHVPLELHVTALPARLLAAPGEAM